MEYVQPIAMFALKVFIWVSIYKAYKALKSNQAPGTYENGC